MTKKERLMAVLNHQQPDHIPVGFWFHFPGEDGIGEKCVKAHLDYYRETDIDFVKATPYNSPRLPSSHISAQIMTI